MTDERKVRLLEMADVFGGEADRLDEVRRELFPGAKLVGATDISYHRVLTEMASSFTHIEAELGAHAAKLGAAG
jgi:hypothetical protein